MDNLVRIIGPAPSEMSREDFIEKRLRPERERVQKALEDFHNNISHRKTAKRKPSKKKLTVRQVDASLAAAGLSIDDLKKFLKEEKKNG